MPSLYELLKANPQEGLLYHRFEQFFRKWGEVKEARSGIHASSIIQADDEFCFREHILGFFYQSNETPHSLKLLRIFAHGVAIHEKWQNIFRIAGVAEKIEARHYSDIQDVYLTPDAVIKIMNRRYVVEIKSMNSRTYYQAKSPPIKFVRQLQFYMHFLSVPYGIILAENKDNQDFKIWPIEYDPEYAIYAIERLQRIRRMRSFHKKTGRLPSRICQLPTEKRALICPMREACFAPRDVRKTMLLENLTL